MRAVDGRADGERREAPDEGQGREAALRRAAARSRHGLLQERRGGTDPALRDQKLGREQRDRNTVGRRLQREDPERRRNQ